MNEEGIVCTVEICMNGLVEGVCVWADNAVCPVFLNHLRRIQIYMSKKLPKQQESNEQITLMYIHITQI